MTAADRAQLLKEFRAGATWGQLGRKYAMGERDVERAVRLAQEEAAEAEPTPPTPTAEEAPMSRKKTCKIKDCENSLGPNNRCGICSDCQRAGHRPKPPKAEAESPTKVRAKVIGKPRPKGYLPIEVLPAVSDLPADYLVACVAEARSRVAAAEDLQEALG